MTSIDSTWVLPEWLRGSRSALPDALLDDESRMRFVVELAARNVAEESGGPFAAAVLDADSGRIVGVGVNRVVPNRCSHAHAEMMAIARAQRRLGVHDLGHNGLAHELVTSCEPCAMCFGAIHWSGVRRLVCGATESDARSIGFDEGPRPTDWIGALEARGIDVATGVCRTEAREVLERYAAAGGEIYNARRSSWSE